MERGDEPQWGVSMESGLEDRNNPLYDVSAEGRTACLNGVRPRRPEQSHPRPRNSHAKPGVSMESGLEDRNNEAAYLDAHDRAG